MSVNASRRDFLKGSIGSLCASSWIGTPCTWGASPKKPNLLIVFPDQMRGQALGFLNEDPYQLKNIADQRPEVVERLRVEMETWLRKNGDPCLNV